MPAATKGQVSRAGAGDLVAARVDEPGVDLRTLEPSRWARILAKVPVAKLAPLFKKSEDLFCNVLEWIDRPFHRIDLQARRTLGWIALALAIAATSLLFFAIL
jgi:hypothetical protein